jgi:hypothetical protein
MKEEEWKAVAPYVDTLCLPIFPASVRNKELTGSAAARAVKVAELVEEELKGRLLLMPPLPFSGEMEAFLSYLKSVLKDWKESGFHHIFLLQTEGVLEFSSVNSIGATTLLTIPDEGEPDETAAGICDSIIALWERAVRE